jgi:hypothetical protein
MFMFLLDFFFLFELKLELKSIDEFDELLSIWPG